MGRDKAILDLGDGPLARRTAGQLRAAGIGRVLFVGGSRTEGAVRGEVTLWSRGDGWGGGEVIADRHPGRGPVGGVATALAAAGGPAVVVACDLPQLDAGTVRALVAGAAASPLADAAVARSSRGLEPLVACWRPNAALLAEALLAEALLAEAPLAEAPLADHAPASGPPAASAGSSGRRDPSMRALCARLVVTEVPVDARSVRNVNRPGDLEPFERVAAGLVASSDRPLARSPTVDVPEIDVDELDRRLGAAGGSAPTSDGPAPALLDVREPDEYAEVRVPGARLLPLGEVEARFDEVPTDGTVYVVCRSGGRSARAVEALRARGIDAVNVAGGTLAWAESGRPTDQG